MASEGRKCWVCEGWCCGLIAHRLFNNADPCSLVYVAQLPGDGGRDWGYTSDARKALVLTHAQAERFCNDMDHVRAVHNVVSQFDGGEATP